MARDPYGILYNFGRHLTEVAEDVRLEKKKAAHPYEVVAAELYDAQKAHEEARTELDAAAARLSRATEQHRNAALRLEQAENAMAAYVTESRARRVGEPIPVLSIPDARK